MYTAFCCRGLHSPRSAGKKLHKQSFPVGNATSGSSNHQASGITVALHCWCVGVFRKKRLVTMQRK